MTITIKVDSRQQELPEFDYAQEQERFLREAIGNELYELLDKMTIEPFDYKAWWNGRR